MNKGKKVFLSPGLREMIYPTGIRCFVNMRKNNEHDFQLFDEGETSCWCPLDATIHHSKEEAEHWILEGQDLVVRELVKEPDGVYLREC